MGVKNWIQDVEIALYTTGLTPVKVAHPFLNLIETGNNKLILNLIPLLNNLKPSVLIKEQTVFKEQHHVQMVQLWEDVWLTRKQQVLSRLTSLTGLNHRIHGRKTIVVNINKQEADFFFENYHLQGTANAKYRFGLMHQEELVAVASFSGLRPMKSKGAHYQSAELIRFAAKNGTTVTGGLTKLINHFCKLKKPDDLMSYADRDWSLGKGYYTSQFSLDSTSEPSNLWLNIKTLTRCFPHRLPPLLLDAISGKDKEAVNEHLRANGYMEIFNTGNLKYILYL